MSKLASTIVAMKKALAQGYSWGIWDDDYQMFAMFGKSREELAATKPPKGMTIVPLTEAPQ